jgi:hypothetical protein
VNGSNPARFRESIYVSTLTVTGRYPGVYGYTVGNRATPTTLRNTFTIEGKWAAIS